jgi:sortase A
VALLRDSIRAVLRFAASVMMVSGVLLIADAGITLAWQEPISAFLAEREQDKLEQAFKTPPRRVIERDPLPGDTIARLDLPAIDRRYFVVEGTDSDSLRKGPGHYPETPLPGQPGTVAIAGHRTTYGAPFRDVDKLDRGDRVELEMPYGTYVYRVEKTRIVPPTQLSVTRAVGYDRLILSACHPLYSAAERIVVFARLVDREPARVSRR